MAGLHHQEDEETKPSVRKATNTAQPRARNAVFMPSAWVRHLSSRLANTPDRDDSRQHSNVKSRGRLKLWRRQWQKKERGSLNMGLYRRGSVWWYEVVFRGARIRESSHSS